MRCETRPRSEARRTVLYVERAPEAATKQIAKRVSPVFLNFCVICALCLIIHMFNTRRRPLIQPFMERGTKLGRGFQFNFETGNDGK
jgi:hypothetical protein